MALWVCGRCTTRYSVGAPACPHCGSHEHYEEGSVMPKITVHGGASVAGASVVGGSWSDTETPDEWPDEAKPAPGPADTVDEAVASVSADGVDLGEIDETLSEAVAGDTTEHVSAPDYETWTVEQLKEELGHRSLSKSGNKAELAERLAQHDVDTADQVLP